MSKRPFSLFIQSQRVFIGELIIQVDLKVNVVVSVVRSLQENVGRKRSNSPVMPL